MEEEKTDEIAEEGGEYIIPTEEEIIICRHCNAYRGTKSQVNGHEVSCKIKTEKRNQLGKTERKKRIPFGVPTSKFPKPDDDDRFHYHVFNDKWAKEPGRVVRALKAGYEVCDQDGMPQAVGTNDDGTAIKGILMRIPIEYYNEDQKLKMKELDKVDRAIKTGKFNEKGGDNRYIPDGIKIYGDNREPQ